MLGIRADAQAAREDVRAARRELDADALLEGDGIEDLRRYADRFDRLAGRLDNPFLSPLRVLPVAGRQVSAADHQASAAASGLRAAADLAEEMEGLVDEGLGSGPERVTTLRQVAETAARGRTRFADLDLGPDDALIGPLAAGYEEIDEALTEIIDGLDRTEAMGNGLADLFEGPSDYLLLAANNAQMQNGQGMFLSAGVLHFEDGRMDLGPVSSLEKVPDVVPPVPLDPDLEARWGWLDPNTDLRHLGLSHRFPVTGATAKQLWEGLGHPAVDGVIAVDPLALQTILRATGPVRTPGGERSADDVVEFILHDQYQSYLDGSVDRSYTTEQRRDELDEIARTVLAQLEGLTDIDADFLDQFRASASGRHLLMWSTEPQVQSGFEAAGIEGQIDPESMLLSLVNRSGVKLDWFMHMAADLELERQGDWYEATVDIAVTNEAPTTGEPRYVIGPYPGSGVGAADYLGLVTLNLPEGAADSRFDGVDRLAVSGADGPNRTIAAWVTVPSGDTVHLVARFRLPVAQAELLVEPSARVHPTEWSFGDRTWHDDERRTLDLDD
jgi:hypothetical protein